MFYLILLTLVFLIITIFLIFGLFRTIKIQTSPNQMLFLSGHIPKPLPDGLYKGSVAGYKISWKGKRFDSKNQKGINIFNTNEEKYPFKTYIGKGIRDTSLDVYKIDYNIPQNPLWLRFILDEIVGVEKGKYLGKVHINLIPGIPITLGYFRLEK